MMLPSLKNDDINRIFPWAPGFQKALRQVIPIPLAGPHLMIGSDYSGAQRQSNYLVYTFLVAGEQESPLWPSLRRHFRTKYLKDGRRMSFKRLGDALRWRALEPFLNIADTLAGLCCAVIVHKGIRELSRGTAALRAWEQKSRLSGKWHARSFERMARTVHFFCLLIAAASRCGQDITWITNEDDIVANDDRLTDVIEFAATMSDLYVEHQLGVLAINSTQTDSGDRAFEDYVAIPDLVSGALAEVVTAWSSKSDKRHTREVILWPDAVSDKANLITSWFERRGENLRRCAILVDQAADGRYGVFRFHSGDLRVWVPD